MKTIYLILLTIGFSTIFCYGQQSDTTVYSFKDSNPIFKYDTCSNMRNSVEVYFRYNYVMPEILRDNGYIGKLLVEFVVEKDGSLSNIKIIRGIDPGLDKSVLNTIKSMPKWEPGSINNQTVRSRVNIPVYIDWLWGKN
jgi:hypothetical protein